MKNIKRRQFLIGGALAVGGLSVWQLKRASPEDAIVSILQQRLDYLKLDSAGVREFARDALNRNIISRTKLKAAAIAGPLYGPLSRISFRYLSGKALRRGEEEVTTMFLLSSDFFRNGSDTSQIVHYLGYYNPSLACGSPFARPLV